MIGFRNLGSDGGVTNHYFKISDMKKLIKTSLLTLLVFVSIAALLSMKKADAQLGPTYKVTTQQCYCGCDVVRCDIGNSVCNPSWQYFCDEVCGDCWHS
jgi:hypothetical protein